MIKQVRRPLLLATGANSFFYVTDDGREFDNPRDAAEWEDELNKQKEYIPPAEREGVFSIQQAINMAVAENRVVRFVWNKDNAEIKKSIDDIKGCRLLKPFKESKEVAVVPPDLDFAFEESGVMASMKGE
jgi:hypothetical protein